MELKASEKKRGRNSSITLTENKERKEKAPSSAGGVCTAARNVELSETSLSGHGESGSASLQGTDPAWK